MRQRSTIRSTKRASSSMAPLRSKDLGLVDQDRTGKSRTGCRRVHPICRFPYIANNYRVLLMFSDQICDFGDHYDTSIADRDKLFEALKTHFGHDWMMLANPV